MKIPVPPLGADASQAEEFEVFSAPSLVRFLSRGVQPPSQIYLKHTDVLRVQCASSQAGESVTFNYRLLRADGALIKGQFIIQVPATRAVVQQSEPMAEGFLLSLSCKAAVATTRGQTFARVFLTAGAYGPNQPSYTLMADYVTTQFAPAHPNGRVLAPVEGPGNPTTYLASNPVAGSNIVLNVPANARWTPKAINLLLITGVAVGNRVPELILSVAGNLITVGASEVAVPASTTVSIFCTPVRTVPLAAANLVWVAMPSDFPLLINGGVLFSAAGLNAADQFSTMQVVVEEWLDNV